MTRSFATAVAMTVIFLSGCGSHSTSKTSTSQTKGSGVVKTERRSVDDFTRVELAGTSKVTVHSGSPKGVVVRGDDNLLHLITTKVTGETLVISQKGDFTSQRGIEVEVSTPSLEGVKLSGTGSLAVTGVHAERFDVDLTGTGSVDASGTAKRVDLTLSGVGNARLRQLVSADTDVVLSGTGSATVVATKSLKASLSGSGSVTYYGLPQHVKTKITGTGAIHPG
jgi:hypothetical protein